MFISKFDLDIFMFRFRFRFRLYFFVNSRRWVQGCRCLEQKYFSEQRIGGAKCNGALALEKTLWGL